MQVKTDRAQILAYSKVKAVSTALYSFAGSNMWFPEKFYCFEQTCKYIFKQESSEIGILETTIVCAYFSLRNLSMISTVGMVSGYSL